MDSSAEESTVSPSASEKSNCVIAGAAYSAVSQPKGEIERLTEALKQAEVIGKHSQRGFS